MPPALWCGRDVAAEDLAGRLRACLTRVAQAELEGCSSIAAAQSEGVPMRSPDPAPESLSSFLSNAVRVRTGAASARFYVQQFGAGA